MMPSIDLVGRKLRFVVYWPFATWVIVSQSFQAEFPWVSRDATPAKRTNNQSSNNISKRTRHMQKCFYVLYFNTQHKREVSRNIISDSVFMKLKTGTLRQEANPWRKATL